MTFWKWKPAVAAGALALFLAGCQSGADTAEDETPDKEQTEQSTEHESGGEEHSQDGNQDSHAMHSSSGEVPDNLMEADDPTFPVGSEVMMNADHMPGMDEVEAIVSGAYTTTAYSVSYTPADGGEPVKDHKWVVHEELEDPGEAPLEPGTEVTLDADHMPGMDGAIATIDSAEQTTVYMVDFVPENSDKKVKNHKWVTEEELSVK
ncbi:YdhK family protein [Bhargavaea beijingensis]|uniref:DUF1541 domain-containing protein n=1 Tax=Bhargavaea beijingensis TaxID=426756 RepID=A0ABX9ZEJ5_9BACL|nr:YdhK family protein [Bhargavaea beijingensis]RSK34909.1 DUF1541 domain-containing protein [Bhargavaea beijingensis]